MKSGAFGLAGQAMVEEFGFGLVDGLSGSGVDCELGFGWAFRVIGQGDVGRVEVGHFGVAGHAMVGGLGSVSVHLGCRGVRRS